MERTVSGLRGLNTVKKVELKGKCTFKFRYVCGSSVSEATTLELIINPGLPDIRVLGDSLHAYEWVSLSFETAEGASTEGFT